MVKKIRIFNPFKRKKSGYKDYVIDLGKMREKGLIREPDEAEVIDLTSSGTSPIADTSTEADSSGLGFLGSLAGAGEDGTTSSETESSASSYNSYSTSGATRDVEEKIDSVSDRVYKLIERIDLLEHKINRIERRSGVSESY